MRFERDRPTQRPHQQGRRPQGLLDLHRLDDAQQPETLLDRVLQGGPVLALVLRLLQAHRRLRHQQARAHQPDRAADRAHFTDPSRGEIRQQLIESFGLGCD
jgi:hypothetical protein